MSDPQTVDSLAHECAEAVRLECGAGRTYSVEAACEFLAMYRLAERKKTSPVPHLLVCLDERDRIVKLIRSKLGAHVRYIDDMSNSDILRSATAACALQGVLDEIDPDFQDQDQDAQAGAI